MSLEQFLTIWYFMRSNGLHNMEEFAVIYIYVERRLQEELKKLDLI